jgi:hypothetical protein
MFNDFRSQSRIAESTITVTFEPGPGSQYPEVQCFAPLRIEGPVTEAQHSKGMEITVGVSRPMPVQPEMGVGWSNEVKFLRGYKVTINGRRWNQGTDIDNQVQWSLQENSREWDGIPQCFNSAIMVSHGGNAVQATVAVKAKTKSGIPVLGMPWSKPKPLIVGPRVSLGKPISDAKFDQLSDKDWSQLAKYDGDIKVSRVASDEQRYASPASLARFLG